MSIFNFAICLIEYYLLSDFLGIFLKNKETSFKFTRFLCVLLGALSLYSFNLLEINWLNPVACTTILFILSLWLFDAHLQSKIILSLFGVTASVVFEFIAGSLISISFGDKLEMILQTPHGWISISIISKLLLMLFFHLVRTYVKKKDFASSYKVNFVFLSPLVSLYVMYSLMTFEMYLPHDSTFSLWLSSIYFLLLAVNLIVFHIYNEQQKTYDLRLELQAAERSQEQQERILHINQSHMDELAELSHDFKNHLITIQSIVSDEPEAAAQYIASLTGQLLEKNQKSINFTNNPSINGILSYAKKECESHEIEFKVDYNFCDLSFLSYSDSCAIFSNAVDNAIDACLKLRQAKEFAFIHIAFAQYKKTITIGIKNSKSTNETIVKDGNRFLSNKDKQHLHGYGIHNMRKAVEKYDGSIVFDYSNNEFCVTIIMPQI